MPVVEDLYLSLGLNTKEAEKKLQQFQNSFKTLLSIGGSFAGIFSLSNVINKFVETNKSINNLSNSLGESYQDIQAWGNAVQSVGGEVSSFNSSLTSLNNNIQQIAITGNSSVLPILNRLGVSVKDNVGNFRKGTEVLKDLSDVFSSMSSTTAQTYGRMLGLDAGTIELLKQGNENLDSLLEKQKKLGLYTKEDGKVAIEYTKSLSELKQSLMAVMSVFARVALPTMKKFNEVFTSIAVFVRKYETTIKAFFITLSGIFALRLIPVIYDFSKALLNLKTKHYILFGLLSTITLLIDDFLVWKQNGDALFGSFWESLDIVLKDFKYLKVYIDEALESLKNFFSFGTRKKAQELGEVLKGNFEFLPNFKNSIGKGLNDAFNNFKSTQLLIGEASNNQKQNLINNFYNQIGFKNTPKQSTISNNTNSNINISRIEINTQATNSQEIANTFSDYLNNNLMNQNNGL